MIKHIPSVLVAALFVACSGAQPPAPISPADVTKELCVASAVKAAGDPRALSPEGAVALSGAVLACVHPAPSSEGDAGAL
jgi:hypothetical protein